MTHPSPTRTAAAPCSAEVEWHSGGPGKSAYSDYRWQCACGNRYAYFAGLAINYQHYAHLAAMSASLAA